MMNEEEYDMGNYLSSAEDIATKKLLMYQELLNNIRSFKKEFGKGGPINGTVKRSWEIIQIFLIWLIMSDLQLIFGNTK